MLGVSGDREELILKDVFRVQFWVFRRGCNNTNDQTSISSLELEDIQEVINGVKKTILETDVSSQARKDLVHKLIRLRIKKEDLENRKYFQLPGEQECLGHCMVPCDKISPARGVLFCAENVLEPSSTALTERMFPSTLTGLFSSLSVLNLVWQSSSFNVSSANRISNSFLIPDCVTILVDIIVTNVTGVDYPLLQQE